MGSETALKLPVIDFTKPDLKPGTIEWHSVRGQVQQALEEYGCFEASFNRIPLELREMIFGGMEELFDLPLQTKLGAVSKTPFLGYAGQYPDMPLFESLGIDYPEIIENVEVHINCLWPQGNQSFSENIQSFSKQLSELDQMIRRMVLQSYDLEKYMDEHIDSNYYALRLLKYKGSKTTKTKTGLRSHRDKNAVTILCQNEVAGLEVQTKNGKWIGVKPSKGSFVVLIGESLYAWSNGRLHPPYHRVTMTGDKVRYSIGMFSIAKTGYIIKVPDELVDEAHPLLFKPYSHDQYLAFSNTEAARKVGPKIEAYCGVSN